MVKWIEIFKAGKWTDAKGKTHSYSQNDLDSIVAVNDPGRRTDARKVPLVIGHPKHTDPAWGWVDGLKREGDLLFMKAKDVVPEFAQAVNDGRYKKVSICVNPTTHELDHVGFLGAVQPAVPGLADAQFAAPTEESVSLEYSSWRGDGLVARMFQGMRNHLIETIGLEKTDAILSQWDIDALKEEAAQADLVPATTAYAAPAGTTITPEAAAIPSAREVELEGQLAQARADLAAQDATARETENAAFCQSLISTGRLLPAQREDALALLATTSAPELAAFSKPGAPGAGELLKAFLGKLPQQIRVGEEIATTGISPSATDDPVALAAQASAYMAEQATKGITLSAADAVTHIQKNKGASR